LDGHLKNDTHRFPLEVGVRLLICGDATALRLRLDRGVSFLR